MDTRYNIQRLSLIMEEADLLYKSHAIGHESHAFKCRFTPPHVYSTKPTISHAWLIHADSCRCGQAPNALCVHLAHYTQHHCQGSSISKRIYVARVFGGTTYGTKFNLEYMHVFYTISLRGSPPYPNHLTHGSHHSLEALLRLRRTKTSGPGAIVASALLHYVNYSVSVKHELSQQKPHYHHTKRRCEYTTLCL